MPKSVSVMKWAPHPLHRFMKYKVKTISFNSQDIPTPFPIASLSLVESQTNAIIYAVAPGLGFKSFDLTMHTWEDVDFGDLTKTGQPVIGIPMSNMFIFCYKSKLSTVNHRCWNWT